MFIFICLSRHHELLERSDEGNALAVQCLGLLAFTAKGASSIPGWELILRSAKALLRLRELFCSVKGKNKSYATLCATFILGEFAAHLIRTLHSVPSHRN